LPGARAPYTSTDAPPPDREDEESSPGTSRRRSAARIDVKHASTVATAIKAAAEEPPDVVLLDLRLPDGSGLECSTRSRRPTATSRSS
jgi:DNA-binding response OmpR family regulator